MNNKPNLEVCFSPALLHLYNTTGCNVVIIDIFRATSTITAALDNGAASVIPVASVHACVELGEQIANSVTGGERDGKIAEGLKHGNSPLEYPRSFIAGKKLILTTTNGTRLLHMIKDSNDIIIGSFLNLTAVSNYLVRDGKPVLLACASRKDRFNLEDTLFAGAVATRLSDRFTINCDSARAAKGLYSLTGGKDYLEFLKDSSHYNRLSGYGLVEDMKYCVTPDLHPVVPILRDGEIVVA